jgi:hypothetical protein
MAALLQITEVDIKDLLGGQEQGDKLMANMSGKAVELVQNRLDMQSFLYMSNFAKGVRRCGEIWLSMARDVYVEPGRKMKSAGAQGEIESVELMRPVIGVNGEVEYENDLSKAEFDVTTEVGPSSSSKRAATVRALTSMMAVTSDPDATRVLQAAALMNLEGEGLADIRDYFRQRLVQMGVIKPTEEEAAMMQAAGQQADPNAVFLQAAAEEAQAKAAKARADVVRTVADAELLEAKKMETLSKVADGGQAQRAPQQGSGTTQVAAEPAMMSERELLEIETMQIENAIKRRQLQSVEAEVQGNEGVRQIVEGLVLGNQGMRQVVEGLGESAAAIGDAVSQMRDAVDTLTESNKANVDRALESINRPKRLVRERGRVVGIE